MQKHKASNNVRTTPFLRIVTVTIVVLGIGYFLILDPYLDNRDKQKFLDAQAFIEETYQEKILPIAEPDEVTRVESCRYSSVKYSQGDLSCSVSRKLRYLETSDDEIISYISIFSEKFTDSLRSSRDNSPVDLGDISITDLDYRLFQRLESPEIPCSISYIKPRENMDRSTFFVEISCSKSARAEHFTVE
ncbi:hypothetical protein BH23PAT2_BH23PAT2_05880 [soil metagenome]